MFVVSVWDGNGNFIESWEYEIWDEVVDFMSNRADSLFHDPGDFVQVSKR